MSVSDGRLTGMQRVRARTGHEIPDRPALQLAVGETVQVGDRDTTWPEFMFVAAAGGSGWVPARNLSQTSGSAIVHREYDTTEMPTLAGEVFEVIAEDSESGWLWCLTSDGRRGWVPINTVEEC